MDFSVLLGEGVVYFDERYFLGEEDSYRELVDKKLSIAKG